MGQSGMGLDLPRARGTAAGGTGRAAHAAPGLLPCADGRVGSRADQPVPADGRARRLDCPSGTG